MGRFLRIFFGCHARSDRSFYWNGKPFPICARCTGELAGMIAGIPLILLWGDMKLRLMILFMLPMTADGFLHPMKAKMAGGLQRGFCLAWPLTACSFISTEPV